MVKIFKKFHIIGCLIISLLFVTISYIFHMHSVKDTISPYFQIHSLSVVEIICRNLLFAYGCILLNKISSGFLGLLFLISSYIVLVRDMAEMTIRLSLETQEIILLLLPHGIFEFVLYAFLLYESLYEIYSFFTRKVVSINYKFYIIPLLLIVVGGFFEVYISHLIIIEFVKSRGITILIN